MVDDFAGKFCIYALADRLIVELYKRTYDSVRCWDFDPTAQTLALGRGKAVEVISVREVNELGEPKTVREIKCGQEVELVKMTQWLDAKKEQVLGTV